MQLRARIRSIAEMLLGGRAKLLVIACNTATAIGEDVAREVAGEHGVEVVPVVEPQAEIAAAITDSGKVGVLATPNTVASGVLPPRARRSGARARGDRSRGAGPGTLHPGRLALRRGRARDGPRLLRATEARRGRHPDPRLHPLPAGGADAAAHPRPRRAPGQRRPRGRRCRPAHPGRARAWPASPMARATTASSAPATSIPSTSSARASCRCPWVASSGSRSPAPAEYRAPGFLAFVTCMTPTCAFEPGRVWAMTTTSPGNTVYTHPVAKVMISIPDDLLERIDTQARPTGDSQRLLAALGRAGAESRAGTAAPRSLRSSWTRPPCAEAWAAMLPG